LRYILNIINPTFFCIFITTFFPIKINFRLYIPNYPQERETSESLNVAIATAVVCAEFRRRLR
jgi:ABC-type nitrate/sulfonate/bicarbonate transport system permease component